MYGTGGMYCTGGMYGTGDMYCMYNPVLAVFRHIMCGVSTHKLRYYNLTHTVQLLDHTTQSGSSGTVSFGLQYLLVLKNTDIINL